jgi:hypothetical protein
MFGSVQCTYVLPAAVSTSAAAVVCSFVRQRVLDTGWLFHTDPLNIGLLDEWFDPAHTDDAWRSISPGVAWEDEGVDYDGVAWYRRTLTLPEWDDVFMGLDGIDDEAELWINGVSAGQSAPGIATLPMILDLLDHGAAGDTLSLAIRIVDTGDYGGIKQPVRIGAAREMVVSPAQWMTRLAAAHPEWPMPGWTRGEPWAWTITGAPDADAEALVSREGAVAPWASGPAVELWLYDPASGTMADGPAQGMSMSLVNGYLPMPETAWQAFDVTLKHTLFHAAEQPDVLWTVTAANTAPVARLLTLLVVVRPLSASSGEAPIQQIAIEDRSLWVNGQPYLTAETAPSDAGVGTLAQVMRSALRGVAPVASELPCAETGDGAAVLAYTLDLGPGENVRLDFAFPDERGGAFPDAGKQDTTALLQDAIAQWEDEIGRASISLPDERLTSAWKASVGYLLLALDRDGPHPGPLAHDAVWVRDGAYIGLALLQSGHPDAVLSYIPALVAAQEPDGRVPPILGENAPWLDDEWDSQGQLIFLIASYYRYTGDRAALEAWYPAVEKAARFLVDLRAPYLTILGPARGLLPPSKSVEDIGPPDWHHYWDDWWAIAGLQTGAELATELSRPDDSVWMQDEADALRLAVLASIAATMGDDPTHIPSAVESLEGSSDARGTVPALWPVEVLSPDMPLVARSFDSYYRRYVRPSDGGYRHNVGHYWPYGGLELAHAYLRLGRLDVLHSILGWTLSHETLPGTYAWAEQVDPAYGGITGGDMPHAWAAADLVTLLREMLLNERDGSLVLFSGAADWWLSEGREISLSDLPTQFGTLSLKTRSTVLQTEDAWEGTLTLQLSGAEPPAGYRWKLPVEPLTVAGPAGTVVREGWLLIPGTGGTVTLTWSTQ